MTNGDRGVWFEAKRFGYGAGLPVAWQGWALLLGYVAALSALAALLAQRHPIVFGALAAVLTVPLLVVGARHTRGGWRWRSGGG